ncbi:HK97 gp10 family phage protein [Pelosinus propionicus]|uniref:Bacteriophage HK97-gp10, putative tail-component n=1 Tax=Pelosinus propionicus DSM 13327 TaxID=1123291 RepID=A0A1I4QBZ4_9FIRM|nr:HK97 gp10 family phage protein [Pelosinus propionicus]SFM37622.1 Bacteriophage HK97-gp10, putative tail-component [Pelosinus propionicus DSM 13327]
MAFGDGLKDMVRRYEGYQQELVAAVPVQLKETTTFIVERVKKYTPPTEGEKYNANAMGDLKAHWEQDSILTPYRLHEGAYTSVVANNLQYASYVENGHRMDKHFVPGLFIVGGQLVYDAALADKGGLMVGTKTKYVRGVYMLDRALREGESHLQQGMRRVLMSVMKKEG